MNLPSQSTGSVAANLDSLLSRLVSQDVDLQHPRVVKVDTPQGELACELSAVDALACSAEKLSLTAATKATWTGDQLKQVSASLSQRLNYLLEPIAAIEFDDSTATLQMRSNPPTEAEESGRSYYELMATVGCLELTRYHKSPRQPRRRISMTFTREVIGRMATDMVAAMAEIA